MKDRRRVFSARPALAMILLLAGCSSGQLRPVEIRWNEEICSYCRMAVSEREFACQWAEQSGARFAFDDIGCLATWLQQRSPENTGVAFVNDFNSGTWLPANEAIYLRSSELKTPMGSGLAAFRSPAEAERAHQLWDGKLLAWEEVRKARNLLR